MKCEKCYVTISSTNWSKHIRTQKHQRNDPNKTITLLKRGRPKKQEHGQTIRRQNNVTRKELLLQAKEYNLKRYSKLNKQQLLSVLSKIKKLFFKKHDLQQLNLTKLINVAKENNIKVNLRTKKDEII